MEAIEARVDIRDGDEPKTSFAGRNGTFTPKAFSIWFVTGAAHIDAVGKRGNVIRGGMSLPPERMDELAMKWLQARGLVMPAAYNSAGKGEPG